MSYLVHVWLKKSICFNTNKKALVLGTECERSFFAPPFPHLLPTPWAAPLLRLFVYLCICLLQSPRAQQGVGTEKGWPWAQCRAA